MYIYSKTKHNKNKQTISKTKQKLTSINNTNETLQTTSKLTNNKNKVKQQNTKQMQTQ